MGQMKSSRGRRSRRSRSRETSGHMSAALRQWRGARVRTTAVLLAALWSTVQMPSVSAQTRGGLDRALGAKGISSVESPLAATALYPKCELERDSRADTQALDSWVTSTFGRSPDQEMPKRGRCVSRESKPRCADAGRRPRASRPPTRCVAAFGTALEVRATITGALEEAV